MTENKAIEELKTSIDLAKMCTQNSERKREIEAHEMAIQALEEIQEFRKQGITIEKALDTMCDLAGAENVIEKYEEIGTIEELQALKEKVEPKKPISATVAKDKNKAVGKIGKCPCCDSIVAEDMLWCDDCGQKLDWSEEEGDKT